MHYPFYSQPMLLTLADSRGRPLDLPLSMDIPHSQILFSLTKTKWHTFSKHDKAVVYDPEAKQN